MPEEAIAEVGIDKNGKLFVKPSQTSFDFIYRAGKEIGWDGTKRRLFSPTPNQRTYHQWFNQVLAAVVGEYGLVLRINSDTVWTNMPYDLKTEIEAAVA